MFSINPIETLKSYGLLIVGVISAFIIISLKMEISSLETQLLVTKATLEKARADKENVKTQLDMCATEVNKVNEQIDNIKADKEEALSRYNETKALPPQKRYEVIYKTIPMGVSNECNDTKSMLSGVRNFSYDRL